MIRSFHCRDTEKLFQRLPVRRFQSIARSAIGRLIVLDKALNLQDLAGIRSNRLEALKGDREGQYSIRINDQWRICFRWEHPNARDVEIVDYH